MTYAVKELFFTLQGEGGQTGRAAVFCRFTGCNLWSGREIDRPEAACSFCDTDFVGTDGVGGGRFASAPSLATAIRDCWDDEAESGDPLVVLTGGEPGLQVDSDLLEALKQAQFEVAIETNGTVPLPPGIDWLTVSPKPGLPLQVRKGTELKLVFPQDEADMAPTHYADLSFEHFFLQPKDGPDLEQNLLSTIAYCQRFPQWRLSLQTHKMIGLP